MAKIAVIGSGISGLASAWILSQEHEVTLYEKEAYVGGHTNTRPAQFADKTIMADTGFMVFNNQTYPNLVKMFEFLNIETIDTDMAFGVSAQGGAFQFSSDNVFVQKKNLFSLAHIRMILDIITFNKNVEAVAAASSDSATLKDLLAEMNLGEAFTEHYLLPMSGEIWSSDKESMLLYPAKKFVSFFNNHGLLSPKTLNPLRRNEGRLQWRTVAGGANNYVEKIRQAMNARVHLNCAVRSITRNESGVTIETVAGASSEFDHVVSATHPNEYLALVTDASETEKKLLGSFIYNKNVAYMHKDTSFMMSGTKQWPSWTYSESAAGQVEISYYMNRLQSIPEAYPIIVTLNPTREIAADDLFYKTVYEHPRFTLNTVSAQAEIKTIQGHKNTWYAGAWLGYGFHEDGLRSALEIGKAFGLKAPWETSE